MPVAGYSAWRPRSARPSVISSAYSRSEPTGRPLASRVTASVGHALTQGVGQVERRRLAGRGRVGGDHDFAHAGPVRDPAEQLADVQVLGVDTVDRRQRSAEHVVAAVELARALDRDHVAGLLDHADRVGLAAVVLADAAGGLGGEVEADLAVADGLLDLADRVGQRQRLLVGDAEDVECEPLGRTLPDAGQARELGDQAVDRRCEHFGIPCAAGRAGCFRPRNTRTRVGRVRRARPGRPGRPRRRSAWWRPAPARRGLPR